MEAANKIDNELMPISGAADRLTNQEIEDFIARNPDRETYEWLSQLIINRSRFPSRLNKMDIIHILSKEISMLVSAPENNEVDERVYRFAKQVLLLTQVLGLGSEAPDQYTLALLRKSQEGKWPLYIGASLSERITSRI